MGICFSSLVWEILIKLLAFLFFTELCLPVLKESIVVSALPFFLSHFVQASHCIFSIFAHIFLKKKKNKWVELRAGMLFVVSWKCKCLKVVFFFGFVIKMIWWVFFQLYCVFYCRKTKVACFFWRNELFLLVLTNISH